MADLVRDDVRLREVTWRLEAVLQVAIEGKVDVELLVVRAVERPHGRLSHAAGRAHHAAAVFDVAAGALLSEFHRSRAANVVPKAVAARRDCRTLLAARRGVGLQRFDEERAALDWLVGRGRRARPVHLAAPLTSTPAGLQ